MADQIQFRVILPPKSAPDVVSRELSIAVAGSETDVRILAADQLVVDGLTGDQGAVVKLSLVDIDDGGNRSRASVMEGLLLDIVAPPMPGTLGIEIVGEAHKVPEPDVMPEEPEEPDVPVEL